MGYRSWVDAGLWAAWSSKISGPILHTCTRNGTDDDDANATAEGLEP